MAVINYSDRLFHVFQTKLTRWLNRAGLPGESVAVREFQKRGALHWHLVFVGRQRGGTWAIAPSQFTALWNDTLSKFVGRKIDSKASTNVQRVKRDASRYLSKYMSKQDSKASNASQGNVPVQPSGRSWNISLKLRRRIVVNKSTQMGLIIWNHRDSLKFRWVREILVEGHVVAIVGQFLYGLDDLYRFATSLPSLLNTT